MITKEDINNLLRREGHLTTEDLGLLCFTFNVGGNDPDEKAVSGLFDTLYDMETFPDLICIGIQEMVELNAQSMIGSSLHAVDHQSHKWQEALIGYLNKIVDNMDIGSQYLVVAEEVLLGLWICLISTEDLRPSLRDICIGHCACGIGGMLANKGGVAVRFKVQDSTVCIVNSHLAAHREAVSKRNDNFHTILYSGMFPDPMYESMQLEGSLPGGNILRLREQLKSITRHIENIELTDSPVGLSQERVRDLVSRDHDQFSSEAVSEQLRRSSATSGTSETEDKGDEEEMHTERDRKRTAVRFTSLSLEEAQAEAAGSALLKEDDDDSDREKSISPATCEETPSPASAVGAPATSKSRIHLHTLLDEAHNLCPDDHDIVVWMGDLNYRLTKQITDNEVMKYIEEGRHVELSDYDQLQQERDAGRVFEDFNEGLRFFQPSYKYIPGTMTFDYYDSDRNDTNLLGAKKKRVPAWCDRVLWRTPGSAPSWDNKDDEEFGHPQRLSRRLARRKEKMIDRRHYYSDYGSNGLSSTGDDGISLVTYNICRNVHLSDHIPVYALLNVRVKKVDWARREALLLNLHRVATEEWRPNEACICGYDQPDGCGGRDMVSLSPTYFDLSVNNREKISLNLCLKRHLASLDVHGEGMAIACGLLAFTVPKWITASMTSDDRSQGFSHAEVAQFAACKGPEEEEWIDLCILQPCTGEDEASMTVTLTVDCVQAMEDFGMDSYRTEARLRKGAHALGFKVDLAANEEEVYTRAERLLKSNGEEVAETCATLCVRCRRVHEGEREPAHHPLDLYVPIKLFLGSNQKENEY